MIKRILFPFALLALTVAPLEAQRRIEQAIHSDTLPRVSVTVDPVLGYLGQLELDVGGRAKAEQHLFGELREGRLARAVIVHFEHFLPANTHTFEYPRLRIGIGSQAAIVKRRLHGVAPTSSKPAGPVVAKRRHVL